MGGSVSRNPMRDSTAPCALSRCKSDTAHEEIHNLVSQNATSSMFDADSFKGRTWDFDSQNRGSSPRSVANDPEGLAFGVFN